MEDKIKVAGRVRQVVVSYSNDCKGIFLDGLSNSLNSAVYLPTCQYFGMGKKNVPSESRTASYRLFIVRVKNVCYERKVRGELLGCFFHCTLECLCPYVPTTTFRPIALRNKVECQCYNEANIPSC